MDMGAGVPRLSRSLIVYSWFWKFKWIKRMVHSSASASHESRSVRVRGERLGPFTIPYEHLSGAGCLQKQGIKNRFHFSVRERGKLFGKTCWFHITADKRDLLSHKALGDNAELPPSVLNQVAVLGHHHVVELLPFLCNHHIGVALHSELETYEKGSIRSDSDGFALSEACTLQEAEDKRK